jgi:LPS export ABC transporter permease LptG
MRVFSKFVIREVIPPMTASLVIFTFVFLMRTIADLAEKLIEYQYTLSEISLLLLYSIPAILGYVIPMSLLLGIIVGLNRLSADSEVIALNASGISSHTFLYPLVGIAVFAWLANTWLLTEAVPWSNQEYGGIILNHSREVVSAEVKPRIFNEDFPGFIIYVNDIDQQDSRRWMRVFIYDQSDNDYPKAILARHADLISRGEGVLDLNMAVSHTYTFPRNEPGQPSAVSRAINNTFHLIEEEGLEERREDDKDNRAKTIPELLSDVDREENLLIFRAAVRNTDRDAESLKVSMDVGGKMIAEKAVEIPQMAHGGEMNLEVPLRLTAGYEQQPLVITISQGRQTLLKREFGIEDFADRRYSFPLERQIRGRRSFELINSKLIRQKTNAYWIEIHKKFALPFTCIIFALLGLPLGLSSRRGGKAYGYVVGITIFILYWGLLTTGERLALYERVSPALGIWLPNIIFGLAAIILLFFRRRAELRLPGLGQFLFRFRSIDQEPQELAEAGTKTPRKAASTSTCSVSDERLGRDFGFPLIIDRYLIKTFLMMFILVFAIVYAVFSLVSFIDINNDIQKNNVDQAILFDYFQFVAPETIRWVIPISALMGTMICFALLSKNAEVIAFKSSGVSIYRLSTPVVVMALLISVFAFFNNDFLIPATAPRLAEIKGIIRNRPIQTTRDPRNRWVLGEQKNRIYHFQLYDEDRRLIEELHVFDIDPESYELRRHIYVRQAAWNGAAWESANGWLTSFSGTTRTPEEITSTRALPIPETPVYFGQEIKPSDQMNYAELADYIDTLEDYGFSTTRENFDLNWKLSFPFLPLVMSLLGLPFAFSTARRGGPLTGIFISIGLVIVYWGMMSLFRALGQTGLLPALLAAWAPNIAFLGVGVLLFATLRS